MCVIGALGTAAVESQPCTGSAAACGNVARRLAAPAHERAHGHPGRMGGDSRSDAPVLRKMHSAVAVAVAAGRVHAQ